MHTSISTFGTLYTIHTLTHIHTYMRDVIIAIDGLVIMVIIRETSTTPSCSGPIPEQKSEANLVPAAVFSHQMLEMDLNHFHRFSWGKIH